MQFYKVDPQFKSFRPKNHDLLKKIDKGRIDIRNVMRYAVEKNYLPSKEWGQMDTSDAWRWLTTNQIDYKLEQETIKTKTPKEIVFSIKERPIRERALGSVIKITDED